MGFFNLIGLTKHKKHYPKNLMMFDFANINKSDNDKLLEYNRYYEFKKEFANKISEANIIKLFKLDKAKQIINKLELLEKEIWGNYGK